MALACDASEEALAVYRIHNPTTKAVQAVFGVGPLRTTRGMVAWLEAQLVPVIGKAAFEKGHYHLHLSPPCQAVSQYNCNMRREGTHNDTDKLALTRWCLSLVRELGLASWSIEQVCSVPVKNLLDKRGALYEQVLCSEYGCAQAR